jgi:hypothetical protein
MGLQCSILGHAFEDAGVEREREEKGSEVVTTERTIERCRRCGTERVVSENTEVTAVVDADDVDIDAGTDEDTAAAETEAQEPTEPPASDSFAGTIERSEADDPDAEIISEVDAEREPMSEPSAADDATRADEPVSDPIDIDDESESSAPVKEDAEILTDEADEEPADREPGEWPEEDGPDDDDDAVEVPTETETLSEPNDEETLSGITVPEGQIACPECSFSIEASSGYRAGDPCPECNAWLETERNQ